MGSSPARRAHVTVRPAVAADAAAVAALLLPFEPHIPSPSPAARAARPARGEHPMTLETAAEHLRTRFAQPDYHAIVAVDTEMHPHGDSRSDAGPLADVDPSANRDGPSGPVPGSRAGRAAADGPPDRDLDTVAAVARDAGEPDGPAGRIVGIVVARFDDAGLLAPTPVLAVSRLAVAPGLRRRGIGRALLTACIELAESSGALYLQSSSNPGARDANRYLARVGFAAVATRRMAPVTSVRRALGLPALGLVVSQDPRVARRRARSATLAARLRDVAHPGA